MRNIPYAPLRDEAARLFSRSKVEIPWPSIPVIVPHRFRRKLRSTRSRLRSRQSPTSSITSLNTSFSPADTLRSLKLHKWSYYDGQYLLLTIIGLFALSIIESPGPFVKTLFATAFLTSLVIPITAQIALPATPVIAWLLFWFSCQFITGDYRPPIWVKILPALENIFYGANLSNILSAHKSTTLDVLAWLPYGITHFGAPFVCTLALFIFGPPGSAPLFARTFGYMNVVGVFIQFLLPCSPPWYENLYGLAPANYKMPGSPAGLAAIDKLFGVDMYTSSFTASPVVFGAFPSLHAGSATTEALFMSHVFPKMRPIWIAYTLWIWWATMYLSHHYAVDLVGGSLLAGGCFYVAKAKFLPRLQAGKMFRWDYDYVEVGENGDEYAYGMGGLDDSFRYYMYDSEDWSMGSSSSYSSGNRSPSSLRSPVDDHDGWEAETLASPTSDSPAKR